MSNVIAIIAAARVTDTANFGIVALVFTVMATALAITRGLLGTPLLLLSSKGTPEIDADARHGMAAGTCIGIALASLILLGASFGDHVSMILPLAVTLPFILVQDVLRYRSMSVQRPVQALFWDGVWTVGSLASLLATFVTPGIDVHIVIWCWSGLAMASMMGLALSARLTPNWNALLFWFTSTGKNRMSFGAAAAIGSIGTLVVASVGAALVGPAATGALRGASTIIGPLSVLMSAIPLIVIPYSLRMRLTHYQAWRLLRRAAMGMSLVAIAVGLMGFLLPTALGSEILGPSWELVAPILPITGIEYAALAWVSCIFTALSTFGDGPALLKARLVYACTSSSMGVLAAYFWRSAIAMAWGLAVAGLLVAALLLMLANRRWKAIVPQDHFGRSTTERHELSSFGTCTPGEASETYEVERG